MTIPEEVLEAATAIVGSRWIRRGQAALETYASDGLPTWRSVPGAVVLPGSTDHVVRLVRLFAHWNVPFVARGAGTGLSGGALGDRNAVVISLTRLNRIITIDPDNRRAIVEPGVVNVRLSHAAAAHGLQYAPDPSSQTACTIGGNVAENAGGPHCLKYGVTSNHVLEVDVVLPDGRLVTLGSPSGDPWGPDLTGLFVGSEGMFGIAVRITVRLVPIAREIRTLLADFTSVRSAGSAVSAIIASGIVPAALEMMDHNIIEVVEASAYRAGYPTDAAAVLLVELDGPDPDAVADESTQVESLLKSHGARSVQTAREPKHRERLWQGRKKAFGALGRFSSALVVQDAVVPRSALPDVLDQVAAISERYHIRVSNVFHAGDGNLHPNLSFNRHDPDEQARVEQASAAIMEACIAAGGTITGEHGVGRDKMRYMPLIFSAETLGAMQAVKQVFDPQGVCNPGKVVPVHACREWSAARNHRGQAGEAGEGHPNPGRKPGVPGAAGAPAPGRKPGVAALSVAARPAAP